MGVVTFIQARWYRQGGNDPVTRVVLHDMEYPEKPDAAEAVAQMFATTDREASAHYCVDNNSVVGCVHETDIAFHAPPNTGSVGIEHAGYARQTTGDWLDAYGAAMLRDHSAPLVRDICSRHGIPLTWLSVDDLKANPKAKGITSHNNVSRAFGQSTHTDPGPNFPYDQYMAWVRQDPTPPPAPTTEEDDMDFIVNVTDDNNPTQWFVSPLEYTEINDTEELRQLKLSYPAKDLTSFAWDMTKRSRTHKSR